MSGIATICPHCDAPMSLPALSFVPLQFGSKRHAFYCECCDKPSMLSLRSRLTGAIAVLALSAVAVLFALQLNDEAASLAVIGAGALAGFVLGGLLSSRLPALVRQENPFQYWLPKSRVAGYAVYLLLPVSILALLLFLAIKFEVGV